MIKIALPLFNFNILTTIDVIVVSMLKLNNKKTKESLNEFKTFRYIIKILWIYKF